MPAGRGLDTAIGRAKIEDLFIICRWKNVHFLTFKNAITGLDKTYYDNFCVGIYIYLYDISIIILCLFSKHHNSRLYSSAVFNNDLKDFSEPEIRQKPADGLLLQMKAMNIDKVICRCILGGG